MSRQLITCDECGESYFAVTRSQADHMIKTHNDFNAQRTDGGDDRDYAPDEFDTCCDASNFSKIDDRPGETVFPRVFEED